jgi:predicted SprT family Zn-dependent metalloprotease
VNTLAERQAWARQRVIHWWNECKRAYPHSSDLGDAPTVMFSNKLKATAGLAYSSKRLIKLSNHFLMSESPLVYDQTIGHEVAHIYADKYNGMHCKHGPGWRRVMRAIGLSPKRCHQYQSTVKRRQERVPFTCDCGKGYQLSKRVCTLILNGGIIRRRSGVKTRRYQCTACRTEITKDKIERLGIIREKPKPVKVKKYF